MSTILSDYQTREELASELKRDVRTLERWAAQQIGPPITYLGKTPYYRRESVRDWLLSLEQKSIHRRSKRGAA